MAHPTIPIEPHIDRICQALRVGATYELAAQFAGISYSTLLRWRKDAETAAPGTPEALLRERMLETEGQAAVGWLAKIEQSASDGNWQAAAWKLERRYPRDYGKTVQEHIGDDEKPLTIVMRRAD